MEAAGYFAPLKLSISVEELLRVECIETFDELFEFCRCEGKSDVVMLMQQLFFNVHLDQYSSTGIEVGDFWDALHSLGLQHSFGPKGVVIYNNLYFQNASDQAQDWISQEMVKPHVRMMKEKLKFTDVQIMNGLRVLHERDEEITFMSLLNTLVPTENAVLNVYVGMGKYAFSADIRLVLRNCYAIYNREPTQEQFEREWNRIKGTGIEHLMEQVEIEKTRADRTEIEALNREALLQEEKRRAEEEKRRAEEEKLEALNRETLLQEKNRRAEEEKLEALSRETLLQEKNRRAEEEKLKAMRDYNNAIEVRNEAVDEIIQILDRENVLKKENEASRVKAVKLEKEKEAARVKAVKLEKEKEAARVKAVKLEKEKEIARVKAVKLEKEKEAERVKAVKLEKEKEAERVKAVKLEKEKEAERVKAVKLEKEKEAERVKAEAERVKAVKLEKEKEAERVKAEMLEKELAKMTALFEEEKKQFLLQMQQMAGLVRA